MSMTSADELEGFRAVQRLAYRCAEEVAATLTPGVSEKDAARRLKDWLSDHGVREWFHLPFAWFGERTAFRGFHTPLAFFPSERRLGADEPFILDVAPVVDGFVADIGYTGSLGDHPELDRMRDSLADHRALILDLVRLRRPFREVYRAVDSLARRQGYEPRHRKYPFGVVAHQVSRLESGRALPEVAGFGLRAIGSLGRSVLAGRRQGFSPLWNGTRGSDHPPAPGMWAVEPHLGMGPVGAKFEELLVVTEDDAFWLDDDLPHVRRFQEARR